MLLLSDQRLLLLLLNARSNQLIKLMLRPPYLRTGLRARQCAGDPGYRGHRRDSAILIQLAQPRRPRSRSLKLQGLFLLGSGRGPRRQLRGLDPGLVLRDWLGVEQTRYLVAGGFLRLLSREVLKLSHVSRLLWLLLLLLN